jgi:hypothetical protein
VHTSGAETTLNLVGVQRLAVSLWANAFRASYSPSKFRLEKLTSPSRWATDERTITRDWNPWFDDFFKAGRSS